MDPVTAAMLAGGAISGVGGFLSGQSQAQSEKAKLDYDAATRARARATLAQYGQGYQPYSSPLQGSQQNALQTFLKGGLSPETLKAMDFQRKKGYAGIARQGAGTGMPVGGRSALAVQLERDIALGAGQMSNQNVQTGLTAGVPY